MIDWQDNDDHGQRRRFSRRPVALPASLSFGGHQLACTAENISPGGAFLRVQLPETAREVLASFALPHGRSLQVRAKVRWRRQMPAGVGIEFDTFLPETQPL
jgi:hypothetical protein